MVDYGTIFSAVLPVFLLVGMGWIMRARGWFSARSEKDVMRLVVFVLYPSLIFRFVLGNEELRTGSLVFQAIGIGYLFIAVSALVVAVIAPLFGMRDSRERGTFAFVSAVYNYGYIAIPVAGLLFPPEIIGVLLVVNVGVDLAIWTVGVTIVSGTFNRQNLKKAFSPPAVAVLIGLPLNYMGGRDLLPVTVLNLIDMLAVCAIPIGIFIIGVAFCELARESGAKLRPGAIVGILFTRHLLLPAGMLATVWILPLSPAVRDVVLIHAAMPCGIFPVVLAKHYGGAGNLAFQAVAASSLVGMLTIPLWIKIGFWVLG
ncbi:AEC family transporter [Ruficoccus sp. ZRK36]|uniref:AEC family transporter n=1 Tax=Ruficoccus sp. ZRK36 TaxID=2866311 RepID=UPI001C73DC03|nr:AEC family transporter [Ruficoccus sp. ZRK36]QYY35912.1 AEC family transporter [Ruficoccus sp. ZRK36]